MDELPLSGNDWQEWADKLLQRHYGPGEYQKIPDKNKGDAGIEGFTVSSGHAYQAYGPEEPLATKERYEKQRIKITNDIKKFINNRNVLINIFGETKISKWILFVPKYDSKELIIHAKKKTEDVIRANLPYVASNFRVCVEDENAFLVERDELLSIGIGKFVLNPLSSSDQDISGWSETNNSLVEVIDDKSSRLSKLDTPEKRREFRKNIIKLFLDGQNMLEDLRQHPQFYEQVVQIKSHREKFLAIESMTASRNGMEFLNSSLEKFQEEIKAQVKLPPSTVDTLKWEAIADWIIRCPLDFQ
ncbi:MAG: hypothetical protein H6668_08145 [Ardenticatenaceae bacterium]|nr:hypothetical protein [Ardenticatenaceae bacterium]